MFKRRICTEKISDKIFSVPKYKIACVCSIRSYRYCLVLILYVKNCHMWAIWSTFEGLNEYMSSFLRWPETYCMFVILESFVINCMLYLYCICILQVVAVYVVYDTYVVRVSQVTKYIQLRRYIGKYGLLRIQNKLSLVDDLKQRHISGLKLGVKS